MEQAGRSRVLRVWLASEWFFIYWPMAVGIAHQAKTSHVHHDHQL
jgi:hypothetical protein